MKTERSRDWLVNRAIEDFVALNAWQISKIEAGVAAAERGELATEADIARVREKLAVSRTSLTSAPSHAGNSDKYAARVASFICCREKCFST